MTSLNLHINGIGLKESLTDTRRKHAFDTIIQQILSYIERTQTQELEHLPF